MSQHDDSEEDQPSFKEWEHAISQEEVFHDESEGDEPSFTRLEHAEPSQHDYSMSSQPATSSQYHSHEESQSPSEKDLLEDIIDEVLHEDSGDAPSFSALDISSQCHSHEESQLPSEEDAAEDELAVFGGAVQSCLDAKEKKGKKQLYKKSQSVHYDKCVLIYIIILYQKTQNTVSLTVISKKII